MRAAVRILLRVNAGVTVHALHCGVMVVRFRLPGAGPLAVVMPKSHALPRRDRGKALYRHCERQAKDDQKSEQVGHRGQL